MVRPRAAEREKGGRFEVWAASAAQLFSEYYALKYNLLIILSIIKRRAARSMYRGTPTP